MTAITCHLIMLAVVAAEPLSLSEPLREDDESDPAQHGPRKAAMAGALALRSDQPSLLVEPQRRGGDSAAA